MIDAVTVFEKVSHCQLSHADQYGPHAGAHANAVGRVEPVNDTVSSNEIPLETLLAGEPMLTLPETADRLGVVVTRVHDLLGAKKLIAHVIDGRRHVPEALFHEGSASTGKFVPGLLTLLADGGYSDEEILRYLFTEDESLPGRPVDALHGQLAREVLRRAQAMAL